MFKGANDYVEYNYANPRPWDTENPDGMHKGQFSDYRFTGGFGLGDRCENYHVPALGLKPFGCEKGDFVSYNFDISGFDNPMLTVRYKSVTEDNAEFLLCGEKSPSSTAMSSQLRLSRFLPARSNL